ncbi:MAG: helix-turn-helix transcriptional regulator [Glaciihabitans sp.]
MVRRKPGALFPLEFDILESGLRLQQENGSFYGFALAKRIASDGGSTVLMGHGTLYKALTRMAEAGLLEPQWEDAERAEAAGRPRRRLYTVTGEGAFAAERERASRRTAERAKSGVSLA